MLGDDDHRGWTLPLEIELHQAQVADRHVKGDHPVLGNHHAAVRENEASPDALYDAADGLISR